MRTYVHILLVMAHREKVGGEGRESKQASKAIRAEVLLPLLLLLFRKEERTLGMLFSVVRRAPQAVNMVNWPSFFGFPTLIIIKK